MIINDKNDVIKLVVKNSSNLVETICLDKNISGYETSALEVGKAYEFYLVNTTTNKESKLIEYNVELPETSVIWSSDSINQDTNVLRINLDIINENF